MSSVQVDAVLAQIRAMQGQLQAQRPESVANDAAAAVGGSAPAQGPSFAQVMRQGLSQVNEMQQSASTLVTRFERGDPGVELADVMLQMQKASVGFRAVSEVRNRLVSAYQDIMNMPI